MNGKQKLELTWIGKENRPKLEPRILLEDSELSYHAKHRVTDKDIFDNRLIYGDNLLALKALEAEFTGKVKCVFIDPPYNTGSAFTHYDDGVEHSIWLSLMRDRLEIIHRLLSPDGVFFCSLDTNELFYAGAMLDEIFGRQNRIEVFVWKKSYGGGAKSNYVVNQSEFVLCYAKDLAVVPSFTLPPDGKALKYYKYKDEHFSTRGPYRLQPLATTSNDERPNLRYAIIYNGRDIWPEKQWQWSEQRVKAAIAVNGIVFTERAGRITVSYKQYLRDETGSERATKPVSIIDGFYTQHGTYESVALFGQNRKFQFPKPEALMQYLIGMATQPKDWVLDSFAGSGTTGAVAHKMGRRWIMVELGDHCHTHIIPRLKKVIDGEDPGGITATADWKGGGGFRYYRLAPSLLEKDKWDNWVINKNYNAPMLAEALCKLEGFTYSPSDSVYWQHGYSTERDFIYITTANLTYEQLQQLSDEVGTDRTLLVLCTAFRGHGEYPNLTVKKIPTQVLSRCEWGHDDYSLKVENLPKAPRKTGQLSLFGQEVES
ncbi:MAG: site-specific DNA-methyltransferase [Syntrophobacteraceae bacterium]